MRKINFYFHDYSIKSPLPHSESTQVSDEGKSKIVYTDVAIDLRKYKKLFTYATNAFFESLGMPYYSRDYYFYALDQMMALGATVEFSGEGVSEQSVTVAGKDSVAVTVTVDDSALLFTALKV